MTGGRGKLLNPEEVRGSLGRNLTFGMLDALGKSIVTGHFQGKSFPTEAQLTKQHGVSRSVTREAMKMLAAKGLVSARPRQGTHIRPSTSWNLFDADVLRWLLERKFSLELLHQFTVLRAAIEPAAAALSALAAGPDGIERIEEGYARMVAAEAGDDNALEADIAFHIAILESSGNPFFVQFRDVVETALRTSIHFTNRSMGHTAVLSEHEDVLKAIKARDAVGARAAMHHLVSNVITLIEDNVAREGEAKAKNLPE